MFGRYLSQLLFVTYCDREKFNIEPEFQDENHVKPFPMSRNLGTIWSKYPQYDETNTLMVSNFYNIIPDFQRNDIVLPTFDPMGKTDFMSDAHLSYV